MRRSNRKSGMRTDRKERRVREKGLFVCLFVYFFICWFVYFYFGLFVGCFIGLFVCWFAYLFVSRHFQTFLPYTFRKKKFSRFDRWFICLLRLPKQFLQQQYLPLIIKKCLFSFYIILYYVCL